MSFTEDLAFGKNYEKLATEYFESDIVEHAPNKRFKPYDFKVFENKIRSKDGDKKEYQCCCTNRNYRTRAFFPICIIHPQKRKVGQYYPERPTTDTGKLVPLDEFRCCGQ